jgi:hypothetical protein
MAETKAKTEGWLGLLGFERRGEPLSRRWLFAYRLGINIALALAIILVSLLAGMIGYHRLEGLDWVRSFGHAAMMLGGMGPYSEPARTSSRLFEGIYALYCGLLLVGVTGLILAPIFHHVMHRLNLPDETDPDPRSRSEAVAHEKSGKPKPRSKAKRAR